MRFSLSGKEAELLGADPRYQAIRAAEATARAKIAELHEAMARALADCETATGRKQYASTFPYVYEYSDVELLARLRPRGDMMRVAHISRGKRQTEHEVEIESVEASVFADRRTYSLTDGRQLHLKSKDRPHATTIHPDDLAKIKSGELKGWRQKEWPK